MFVNASQFIPDTVSRESINRFVLLFVSIVGNEINCFKWWLSAFEFWSWSTKKFNTDKQVTPVTAMYCLFFQSRI